MDGNDLVAGFVTGITWERLPASYSAPDTPPHGKKMAPRTIAAQGPYLAITIFNPFTKGNFFE
jgi:hypothetical protein